MAKKKRRRAAPGKQRRGQQASGGRVTEPLSERGRDLKADEAFEAVTAITRRVAPIATRGLVEAHKARSARLVRVYTLLHPVLPGIEQALSSLSKLRRGFERSSREKVAILVDRAIGDLETGLDAMLSGRPHVLSDAMRDTMEVELLLWGFNIESGMYEEWAAADREVLVAKFKPGLLRNRIAGHISAEPIDLPDKFEYEAHSSRSHPTPDARNGTKFFRDSSDTDLALWASDLMQHAYRLLMASDSLVQVTAGAGIGLTERDTDRVQAALAFLTEGLAEWSAAAGEAGLVLPPRAPFYRGSWKGLGEPPPKRQPLMNDVVSSPHQEP